MLSETYNPNLMIKSIASLLLFAVSFLAYGQQGKDPTVTEIYKNLDRVTPGEGTGAPSDAIVLFDGKDLSKWQKADGSGPAEWTVNGGEVTVKAGTGNIATKQAFGDVQLHVEWMSPKAEGKSGQGYNNSGIFLMGLYEVQVLNSYDSETYQNGQAGSVYKQYPPLVNASLPPGTWQKYDIIFTAPRFSEKGTVIRPATLTVFHNGVLVQNASPLLGPTEYIGLPQYKPHAAKLPLQLQDHSDPVRFRNIWVREL